MDGRWLPVSNLRQGTGIEVNDIALSQGFTLQDFHKDSELDGFTEMIGQHLRTIELLC